MGTSRLMLTNGWFFSFFFSKDTALSSGFNPETTEKWWLDVWYCLRLSHLKKYTYIIFKSIYIYIYIYICTYSIAVVCLRKGSQTKIGLVSFTAWINGGPIFRSVSPASPADGLWFNFILLLGGKANKKAPMKGRIPATAGSPSRRYHPRRDGGSLGYNDSLSFIHPSCLKSHRCSRCPTTSFDAFGPYQCWWVWAR